MISLILYINWCSSWWKNNTIFSEQEEKQQQITCSDLSKPDATVCTTSAFVHWKEGKRQTLSSAAQHQRKFHAHYQSELPIPLHDSRHDTAMGSLAPSCCKVAKFWKNTIIFLAKFTYCLKILSNLLSMTRRFQKI